MMHGKHVYEGRILVGRSGALEVKMWELVTSSEGTSTMYVLYLQVRQGGRILFRGSRTQRSLVGLSGSYGHADGQLIIFWWIVLMKR